MNRLGEYAERFTRSIRRYADCCARMEKEHRLGRLRITDIELVYSSSFLSVCSRWETFLEGVLIECVCGVESSKPGNWRKATFRSRKDMSSILTHRGSPYLSVGTVEDAERLMVLLVNKGRPVSAVSEANRTLIGQATQIRNAIAHDSTKAKQNFREKVPGVRALANSRQTPGAFLRHEYRAHPNRRRYEIYFAAFQMAANEIGSAW